MAGERRHPARGTQGIEREGADFAALEVALRREQLIKLETEARLGDPVHQLRVQVERADEWVARASRPSARHWKRWPARRRGSSPGCEAGRPPRPSRADPARRAGGAARARERGGGGDAQRGVQRLKMVLIKQAGQPARPSQVATGRLGESDILHATLGPFPEEEVQALACGRVAHAIASYRVRYAVFDELSPFGVAPRDPAVRVERDAAIREVSTSLRSFQRTTEIGKQLSLDHGLSLDR